MPACEQLLGLALELGAEAVGGWSAAERARALAAVRPSPAAVRDARARIDGGGDPLGDAYLASRTPAERRGDGATYTPHAMVALMVDWAAGQGDVVRVIDPGIGSGRFAVAAGRRFEGAHLVGIDSDPVAAILARGHLAAAGAASRAQVYVADFARAALAPIEGRTLVCGNPPYVRHHGLTAGQKTWLARAAASRGLRASKLAGLHVHFYFAAAAAMRAGDVGVFVTAAEWLDVNYGAALRALLAGELGLQALQLIAAESAPFPDAQSTAAIAAFVAGAGGPAAFERVTAPRQLGGGRRVARARLRAAPRWSALFDPRPRRRPAGIELGALCRVSRGQVTGANAVWIAGASTPSVPACYLVPAVTRARELIDAQPALADARALRRVIDLPAELGEGKQALEVFLRWARARGAADAYVARHRRPWWSVRLHPPAPILATYMARRPPVFVRNRASARHLNIAHGLYPREPMTHAALDHLCERLNAAADGAQGRVYAGGLVKFEPREMERIRVEL